MKGKRQFFSVLLTSVVLQQKFVRIYQILSLKYLLLILENSDEIQKLS